jgi:hypothetical protein
MMTDAVTARAGASTIEDRLSGDAALGVAQQSEVTFAP